MPEIRAYILLLRYERYVFVKNSNWLSDQIFFFFKKKRSRIKIRAGNIQSTVQCKLFYTSSVM